MKKQNAREVILTIAFLLLLLPSLSFASTLPISSYQSYSIDDGLSQVSIYDIEQDLNGYIWLATQRGVNRFDGYSLIYSDNSDGTQPWLDGAVALDIALDENTGDMWFGTRNGLEVLRASTGEFESFAGQLSATDSQEVFAVHVDDNGDVWVGTNKSVYVIYKQTTTMVPIWTGAESIVVNAISSTNDGLIWVSTNKSLQRFDTNLKNWLEPLLIGTNVSVTLDTGDGSMWAASNGEGLYVIDKHSFTPLTQITTQHGLASDIINDLDLSIDGKVWVSTIDGISIIDVNKTIAGQEAYSNNTLNITNLTSLDETSSAAKITNALSTFHHPEGFVFIGTLSKGFSIINAKQAMFSNVYLEDDSIPYSIAIKDDENIWLSSDKGLYRINHKHEVDGPFTEASDDATLISNILQSATYSHKNDSLLIGSRTGLRILNQSKMHIEKLPFDSQLVYSLSETQDGNLFLGTRSNGLFLYDLKNKSILKHWEMPLSFNVQPINDEQYLVPTTNGLYLLNILSDEMTIFKNNELDPTTLASNIVTWVSKRAEGEYFVGTQNKGLQLMRYDGNGTPPSFQQLFVNTELSSLSIGAVVEDANGNFWITTTQGIAKSNPELNQITFYGKSDGAKASGYFIGSYAVNSNGRIYFTGPASVTHFHPDEILSQASSPSLQFTKIKMIGSGQGNVTELQQSISQKNSAGKLVLQPNNLALSIEFSALEFGSPDKIQYAYKLEGFHEQWQYTDARMRSASFTNLIPGKYEFKVMSTNRYQEWNNEPISLELEVLAPWWKSRLAIFIWIVLLIVTGFLVFKWRVYALYQRQEVLGRLVNEKTLDLEKANEKLKQLSIRDPLTQTLNRRGFMEYAEREMFKFERKQQGFSLILLDVDHFKNVNDTYGHELGDKILIEITKTIQSTLRQVDLMARWGGEEFIILLPDTKLEAAESVANKLRLLVEKSTLQTVQQTLTVTFSAGVSQICNAQTLDECIKQADIMLYTAKHSGRNMVRANHPPIDS